MKYKFKTKWINNEITCICTLNKHCAFTKDCEELDFHLNKYEGINDIGEGRVYKKVNGRIKQIK